MTTAKIAHEAQITLATTFIKNESFSENKKPIFALMIEVNIIGTGNVAWHLATALSNQNKAVLMQVAGRSTHALQKFEHIAKQTVFIDKLTPATVTIIAVSDDAIIEVSKNINYSKQLVVHTSGFTTLDVLDVKHRPGVFYPLQSFSKKDTALDFTKVPILIEAQNREDEKILRELAATLSQNVQVATSKQRKHLHLAAVFANNFTNHCYTIAERLCKEQTLDFTLLHPLLEKTMQKAISNGPSRSQTGPAMRNDQKVINEQEKMLDNSQYKTVYTILTNAIIKTYGKKL